MHNYLIILIFLFSSIGCSTTPVPTAANEQTFPPDSVMCFVNKETRQDGEIISYEKNNDVHPEQFFSLDFREMKASFYATDENFRKLKITDLLIRINATVFASLIEGEPLFYLVYSFEEGFGTGVLKEGSYRAELVCEPGNEEYVEKKYGISFSEYSQE